jgi:hypothetical protein
MKLVQIAIAVSLLASCKDRPREPSPSSGSSPSSGTAPAAPASGVPASGAPPAAPTPDICRNSYITLDRATCPTPEARQSLGEAKKAIGRIVETIGKIGGTDLRQLQAMCAQMFLAIESDAAKLKCEIPIDASQRKEIMTLLDAWYGQRTPVAPTGDATSDAVIARIAAIRDAACECRDPACLDRVDKQLVSIGPLPATAPDAARALGRKLLEDAGRCASRVRTLGDPPR